MTLEAGARHQKITLQRFTATTDDYGGETQKTYADLSVEWAEVVFGTGRERRAAVQEGGIQAATFNMLNNSITRSLTLRDRISYLGSFWDIQSVNPIGDNKGITVTATRSE